MLAARSQLHPVTFSAAPADEPDKSSHEAHTNADKTLAASGSKKIISITSPSNKSHENERLN